MTQDVFGTARLRRAVTEAWSASPARFREDANTEEDHARGSYRDRVVVELAQNAADAATRAGTPGSLRLELRTGPAARGAPGVLVAASTGSPLDADGVVSLAGRRASAKRGQSGTTGRFGVGFAAVRSVSDDVTIASRSTGGVRFSVADTHALLAELVAGSPALGVEVGARGDVVPALRLPFPAPAPEPDGAFETEVVLVLRDDAAVGSVRAQLAAVDDALLIALPALARVEVVLDGESAVLADVEDRWLVVRAAGVLSAGVLATLPVEQRERPGWQVAWALPRPGAALPAPHVVRAPTPTDDALTLPAVLVASLPVDPGRRRVVPGPVAAELVSHSADLYAELARRATEVGTHPLALVPTGLPGGELDGALHDAVLQVLTATPLLDDPSQGGRGAPRVRPGDARFVPGAVGQDPVVLGVLAAGTADLVVVPDGLVGRARACGVAVVELVDAVEALPVGGPPAGWREVYDALAPWTAEPGVTEALATLPVPLADGRTVRGARGVLVPEGAAARPDADLAALGLRVVAPVAVHPLLERLGARPADAFALLGEVRASAAEGAPAEVLLDLVAAALEDRPGLEASRFPFWLGETELATSDGGTAAARECALPDGWAARVLDLDVVASDVVERHGAAALRALGVHDGLDVYVVRDVVTPDGAPDLGDDDASPEGWLDGWSDYLDLLAARLGQGVHVGDLAAVADLDAAPEADLGSVVEHLAADADARRALLDPVRLPGRPDAPSYTAWWVRDALGEAFALPGVEVPLVAPAPPEVTGIDPVVLRAVGGVASLADLDDDGWAAVLAALPPVGSAVDAVLARHVWDGLTALAASHHGAVPPLDDGLDRVPVLDGDRCVMAHLDDVDVAASPCWAQVRPVVPAPAGSAAALADLLDVPLLPDPPAPDAPVGRTSDVGPEVRAALRGVPATWVEHDDLAVGGVPVDWWVEGSGADAVVHATTTAGLARGLALAAGRFDARHLVLDAITDPDGAGAELALGAWDGPQSSPR